MNGMSSLKLILRGLVHYRRTHAGLLLGTALASAILTGALVVGDCVDYTLHTYALERIGHADFAVFSGKGLFSQDLAQDMRARLKTPVAAILLLPGMAIHQIPATGKITQVNRVQAIGVGDEFWKFGDGPPFKLGKREAVLDKRLAAELGVHPGDTIDLRVAKRDLLSRDAPLSSREQDAFQRGIFTVKAIASDQQLGRFGLAANEAPPKNVFVRAGDLQDLASAAGQVDMLLIGQANQNQVQHALNAAWKPEYTGLHFVRHGQDLQLETNRIFLDNATARVALAIPGAYGTLSYLVNGFRKGDRFTPYSFVVAGGADTRGLPDNQIIINAWLADKLDAHTGDTLKMTYYEVTPTNHFVQRSRDFTVNRVASMEEFAADKSLVPNFPGLSDVESCRNWKIGMPMDPKLLRDPANEAYWRQYRQTPKALVTLAAGQAMWGNRFGKLTAVRFAGGANNQTKIAASIADAVTPADEGLILKPVRKAALKAAQAADLGGLFLGLSFFLLISALILIGLFYAFSVQQRAAELGALVALGFRKRRIKRLMLGEAALVACVGAALGSAAGTAYAWALIIGLARYWSAAVGHIPILFELKLGTMVTGAVSAIVCALIAAAITLRRLMRRNASELLSADFSQDQAIRPIGRIGLITAFVLAAAAAGAVVYALVAKPADATMPFFASGALVLAAGLLVSRHILARAAFARTSRPPTIVRFALMNGSRRRGRSLSMIASLAAGGFLVLAVSAMQKDIAAHANQRSSGTGGFALYAESTVPIIDPAKVADAAPGAHVVGIRVHDGDDASCLNLNHTQTPRVLGVDEAVMSRLKAFLPNGGKDVWKSLNLDLGKGVVPALVGDTNTAMWTLQKTTGIKNGDVLTYPADSGRKVSLKLVGTLPTEISIFQGTVLVSMKSFTKLWPSDEGFRVFLIDLPPGPETKAIAGLRDTFNRYGLDVVPAVKRLEMFYAVEATYLNMFLALGGIGLLLGAMATGVVVLRNLLERRREIALLRAMGFPPRKVFSMLLYEYGFLLIMGTVTGAVASALAMAPTLVSAHGAGSPAWRLAMFALVLASAILCVWVALLAGLRKTDVAALRVE